MIERPLVSIITPSFNSARFIEATIRSVLAQDYPNLEYIVVDGGSTDGTVAILGQHSDRIRWCSEPDAGQSDALNKGLRLARGSIIGWINSDDEYAPGAVSAAVGALAEHSLASFVYSDFEVIDESGATVRRFRARDVEIGDLLLDGCVIAQQSAFFRKSALLAVGGIDADLHYVMDYDLFLRLLDAFHAKRVPGVWGRLRVSAQTKTGTFHDRFWPETLPAFERVFGQRPDLSLIRDEAFRRAYLRAGLYCLRSQATSRGLDYLRQAFKGRHYPYGGLDGLGEQIVDFAHHHAYVAASRAEVGHLLDLFDSGLRRVDRAVAGQVWMVRAFGAHKRGDRKAVWRCGANALRLSALAWRNRGLLSIVGRSALGAV